MTDKKFTPHNPSSLPIRIRASQGTSDDILSDDLVHEFRYEVKQVLLTLGHPTAVVYDTTCVYDLGLSMKELAEASIKLGTAVSDHNFIVNIARHVRERNKIVERYKQHDGYVNE